MTAAARSRRDARTAPLAESPAPKARSTDWTRRRLDWIDAIALDQTVSAEAFRLAHILGSLFMNPQTGDAWPSQERLALLLGVKERQVRNLLEVLIAAGWIRKRRGGKGRPNRYAMTGNESAGQKRALTGNDPSLDRQSNDLLTGNESAGESRVDSRVKPETGLQPVDGYHSTADGRGSALGSASPTKFRKGEEIEINEALCLNGKLTYVGRVSVEAVRKDHVIARDPYVAGLLRIACEGRALQTETTTVKPWEEIDEAPF